ncbi:hypothetical protein AnigIFM59636_001827 [Aspergillus niger]|nr:hypothetical protein AnigIFM59636_001827 [Aspergillus niger]
MIQSLSLRPSKCVPCGTSGQSKLLLRHEGRTVAADSILEIKTRVAHKSISVQEVLPQLWASQTPNLVRAYHKKGVFAPPKVEHVVAEIKEWEESHREDLRRLGSLFKKLIDIVKRSGGKAAARYDCQKDRLEVWTAATVKMLPDDLYSKLDYGYRFCFRSLPVDSAQYHTLCETYDFLGVDVVGGQTIDHNFVDLRACKTDYELEYKLYRAIKGDKTLARDAAFRLLFLILKGEFRDEANDSAKAHNAVLFIVSHPGTFKYRTRTILRAAYEEPFVLSRSSSGNYDEDTVNSAFIKLLNALTSIIPGTRNWWRTYKRRFNFSWGSVGGCTARTDGQFEHRHFQLVKVIMECKRLLKVQKYRVVMQEVSELVAWIKENSSCPMSGPIH